MRIGKLHAGVARGRGGRQMAGGTGNGATLCAIRMNGSALCARVAFRTQ